MRRASRLRLDAGERRELRRFVRGRVWYQSLRFGGIEGSATHDTERLLRRIGWPPFDLRGATFLDAGCHSGAHLYAAIERGARQAVGLEVSPTELALARRVRRWKLRLGEVDRGAVRIVRGDVEDARRALEAQELPRRYDLVHFFSVLQHLHRPLRALREIAALTARALVVEAVCEPEDDGLQRYPCTTLPEVMPLELRPQELVIPLADLVELLRTTGDWRAIERVGKGKRPSREIVICWR